MTRIALPVLAFALSHLFGSIAPAAPAGSSAPTAVSTSQVESYREKMAQEDRVRSSAMAKAVGLAHAALERARKAGQRDRVSLLKKRVEILEQRLDLLRQIADFRQDKFAAQRRGDEKARREADQKIEAAYAVITSRQAEERELRKKLESPTK